MKCQTLFSGTNKKNISKCHLLIFFFDCVTGMCNYYFCEHSMKYSRVKDIINLVTLRELDCIPDKLPVSSQSDDRNTHTTCCTPIMAKLIAPLVELYASGDN